MAKPVAMVLGRDPGGMVQLPALEGGVGVGDIVVSGSQAAALMPQDWLQGGRGLG